MRWVVEPPAIPDDPAVATRSLLLCCTPRCGSWLLADLLEQSGVAGRPHEWLWRDTVAANKRAWASTTTRSIAPLCSPPARRRTASSRRRAIAHLLDEIRTHNESWRAWFVENGVSPLDVRYEQVAADPHGEARRVLDFLGVDAPPEPLVPRTRRVGDAENAAWAARFLAVP